MAKSEDPDQTRLVVLIWICTMCKICLSENLGYMCRVMRKPAFCICKNKAADQLRRNCTADQRLCFRYIDSTFPLLAIQPGLCQTRLETLKTGFLATSTKSRYIVTQTIENYPCPTSTGLSEAYNKHCSSVETSPYKSNPTLAFQKGKNLRLVLKMIHWYFVIFNNSP